MEAECAVTKSGQKCKKCLQRGFRCVQHGGPSVTPTKRSDVLRGTPPLKRKVSPKAGSSKSSAKASKKSSSPPRASSPKKSPSKKVFFSNSVTTKKIPPRNPNVKGGVAWARPITDLQAECVSSVIDAYGIWDEEDFADRGRMLNGDERKLVGSCIKIMNGENVGDDDIRKILKFSADRESRRDVFRRMTMMRERGSF